MIRTTRTFLLLGLLSLTGASPALADISIQAGGGRDDGVLEMVTLFNRESTRDEWISWNLHFGRIRRQKKDRLLAEDVPESEIEKGEEWEEFPFYGFDMAVGHTSLNPYTLILLGVTHFEKETHRIGTPDNFHLGLEWGAHGPSFGWFFSLHHWSNGPELSDAPGPNDGEEFLTFGIEWRF